MALVNPSSMTWRPIVQMLVAGAGLFLSASTASAQCEGSGQCFCNADGTVTIGQLIAAVNVALGQADCPGTPLTPTPTNSAIPTEMPTLTPIPTATPTEVPPIVPLEPDQTYSESIDPHSDIDTFSFNVAQESEVILNLAWDDGPSYANSSGCLEIRPQIPGMGLTCGRAGEIRGSHRIDLVVPPGNYTVLLTASGHANTTWTYDVTLQLLPATGSICDSGAACDQCSVE